MPTIRNGFPFVLTYLLRPHRPLLWLLLALACSPLHAQIYVDAEFTDQTVGHAAYFYVDPNGTDDLQRILALPDHHCRSSHTDNHSFGFIEGRLWFRLSVHNHSPTTRRLGLEIAYPVLDQVDAYVIQHGTVQRHYPMGDTLPFHTRPVEFHHFVAPFELAPTDTVTLYIGLQSEGAMQAPMTLWDLDRFFVAQQPNLIVQGLYFGIILVMMFYNLFIYVSVRRPTYLYYTFTVISYGVLALSLRGLGFQFVWPEYPGLNAISIPFSIALLDTFAKLFSISLLNLRHTAPALYKAHITIIVTQISLFFAGLWFLPYHATVQTQVGGGIFSLVVALFHGF